MIIDILCGTVPVEECFAAAAARNAELIGYGRHFQRDGTVAPNPRNRRELIEDVTMRRELGRARCPTPDEFRSFLDDAGVDRAVVTGAVDPFAGGTGGIPELVAEFCATDPSRYIGMCWVDPYDGDAASQVDHLVGDLGIGVIGVGHTSMSRGLAADDAKLGPIYGRCQALRVPVSIGSAINWYTKVPYDLFHPRYIDAVASAFPDLKIIAAHGGWPWVMDMVMVAWRHPNVYIDISTHRARQFTNPALGWQALMHFGDRAIADRVLFGSSAGLAGGTLTKLVREVRELPLRDTTIEKWLGLNAEVVLSRD